MHPFRVRTHLPKPVGVSGVVSVSEPSATIEEYGWGPFHVTRIDDVGFTSYGVGVGFRRLELGVSCTLRSRESPEPSGDGGGR